MKTDRVLTDKEWMDAYLEWCWELTFWAIEKGHL